MPSTDTIKTLRFTPRRKRLLDVLDLATHVPGRVGFQTTDGVPTHLILNGHAVSEATSADFRAMLDHGLLLIGGQRVTVTMWGIGHRQRWEHHLYADDPRVAAVTLFA